jgi:hypothetical protein
VLARVAGEAITSEDVIAAEGCSPEGKALAAAVERLVERRLVLYAANKKALAASADEVARAAALANKAYGPNGAWAAASYRRYLAEEITITKYIDLYVFPRIDVDEGRLRTYFVNNTAYFVKKPPASKAEREKLFSPRRNEVLYRYVRDEIIKALREDAAAARDEAGVQIFGQ